VARRWPAQGKTPAPKRERGRARVGRSDARGVEDDRVSAADVINIIHEMIFVPEGRFVGRPLRLDPWQQVDPVTWQGIDNLTPKIPLQTIEVIRSFRAATSRKNRDHGEF
jgi:hypothetical protein